MSGCSSMLFFKEHELDGYKNHPIFSSLDEKIEFYELLSYTAMSFHSFDAAISVNLPSCIFSSLKGTIESIKLCLTNGRIGDAFSLLRKYQDAALLNIYLDILIEEKQNDKNFNENEINKWIAGTERLPDDDYRKMLPYVKKHSKIAEVYRIIDSKSRERMNSFTHFNSLLHVIANDNESPYVKRFKTLNTFSKDFEDAFMLHFGCLMVRGHSYMMSTDYIDHLEMRMEPPEGSQYWVSTFVQDMFTQNMKTNYIELADYVRENTYMDLK